MLGYAAFALRGPKNVRDVCLLYLFLFVFFHIMSLQSRGCNVMRCCARLGFSACSKRPCCCVFVERNGDASSRSVWNVCLEAQLNLEVPEGLRLQMLGFTKRKESIW